MPSFIERLIGLSFRAELLMMNILGLVNSTLDWSPLKWTNQLDRIWNLSLSQQSHILDTIGEHTIKTILSWVVIARIIIAHVYTFTYVTNIYSILTWSRPNLLLPWMVLSFFKNVVLEVIVIVIGLLLWYEQRFSILLFLEFILVKGVPLVLATYNWYSNSCLFLQLRRVEKMRRLRTTMKRDSDNRLARSRTKSLTTLLSNSTDDTGTDSHDSVSLIIDDPTLTPGEKVMRLLGLTEWDIKNARENVERRSSSKDKSAEVDENCAEGNKGELSLYFSMDSEEDKEVDSTTEKKDDVDGLISNNEENKVLSGEKKTLYNGKDTLEIYQRIKRLQNAMLWFSEKENGIDRCASMKKREATESIESKVKKQLKISPLHSSKGVKPCLPFTKKGGEKLCSAGKQTKGSMIDKTNFSPLKQEILFDLLNSKTYGQPRRNSDEAAERDTSSDSTTVTCDCELKKLTNLRGVIEEGSRPYESTFVQQTSTPNETVADKSRVQEMRKGVVKNLLREPQVYSCDVVNLKPNSAVNRLDDDTKVSGKAEVDTKLQRGKIPVRELLMKMSAKPNMPDVTDDPSKILQNLGDLGESAMLEMQKLMLLEREDDATATVVSDTASLRSAAISESAGTEAMGSEKMEYDPYASDKEENASSLDISKDSLDDSDLSKFFKDSMKVFDKYYEKDFAKNTEFQGLLRQTAKKNWNFFVSHMNNKQSDGTSKKVSSDIDDCRDIFGNVKAECSESQVTHKRPQPARYEDLKPTSLETYSEMQQSKPQEVAQASNYEDIHIPFSKDKKASRKFPKSTDSTSLRKKFYSVRQNRQHSENKNTSLASNLNVDTVQVEQPYSSASSSAASLKHSSSRTSNGSRDVFWRSAETRMLPETESSESVCPCETQSNKTKAKSSKFDDSSNSMMDDKKPPKSRKDTGKIAIESFGTVSLAQAARPSGFEKLTVRGKPPVPPRKTRIEKQDERSVQTKTQKTVYAELQSTMQIKSRRPIATLEERKSREMRALRAYNAATLQEDKRRLRYKSRKSTLPTPPDFVDPPINVRKSDRRVERYEKSSLPREVEMSYDDYLDKENLFAEASIGTDPSRSNSESSKSDSRSVNKKSKIDKFTEISHDHFDGGQASQIKGEYDRSRTTDETATRKFTEHGRLKISIDNDSALERSTERFEGLQKGRDLGRTAAKEDVRDHFPASGKFSIIPDRLHRIDTRDNFTSIDRFRNDRDDLVLTAASTVTPKLPVETTAVFEKQTFATEKMEDSKDKQDVTFKMTELIETQGKVSIYSPNVTDRAETKQFQPSIDEKKKLDTENSKDAKEESLKLKSFEKQNIAKYNEDSKDPLSKLESIPEDPIPSTSTIEDVEEKEELTPQVEENRNRTEEFSRDYDRMPKRVPLDIGEITRNIDKSYCLQGVILTNNNLRRESLDNDNRQEYHRRSIVDDSTASALHVALSHKPQIIARTFLRDPPSFDGFSNIRNMIFDDNPQISTSDRYACHSNRDNIQQDSANSNQIEGSRDTDIITIDDDELPVGATNTTLVESINTSVESGDVSEISRTCDILDALTQLLQDDGTSSENFESPPEPSSNDEQRPVSPQSNIERGDETAMAEEKKLKEDANTLPIFQDLQFPTVIGKSDLKTTVMTSLNDYLEPSYVITNDVESIMADMISSVARRSNEENESRRNDDEILTGILEDRCDDQTGKSEITERETVEIPPIQSNTNFVDDVGSNRQPLKEKSEITERETVEVPPIQSNTNSVDDVGSNCQPLKEQSWDTSSCTQWNNGPDELGLESVDTNKIEGSVEIETIVSEENASSEDEKHQNGCTLVRDLNNEENDGNTENDNEVDIASTKAMEATTEENNVAAPVDERLSVTRIVMFPIIVLIFYLRYLFDTVCSFSKISRSTSTLRPFDIHTVSTSISRVFDERVIKEVVDEPSESDAETAFEESVRFKQIKNEDPKNDDTGSLFMSETAYNIVGEMQELTVEEIRQKVEAVIEKSAENSIVDIELPSTSMSNDINKIRKSSDRSDTDIQETVIRSQDLCTIESEHFLPNISNATSNDAASSPVLNTEGEIKSDLSMRNTPSKSFLDTFIRNLPPSDDKSDDRTRDLASAKAEIDEELSHVQLPEMRDTERQSKSELNLSTEEECQKSDSKERIDVSTDKINQREDSSVKSNSVENDGNGSTTKTYTPVLGPFFHSIVDTDSFDTTYSRNSEMSEDTASLKGGSTMEDFPTEDSTNSMTNNSSMESEDLE